MTGEDIMIEDQRKKHLFSAREIAVLIFPLLIEQLLSITIGMADTIMVSSYSETAVSAVSSVDLISQLFINLFAAFSTGGAVIVSQYLGNKDTENARTASRNLVYISLALSLVLLVIALLLRNVIVNLVLGKAEAQVQKDAMDYYIPIMFSFPFLAVFNATTAISRSERKTTRTMLVALLINVVNICGNYLLIHVADLGAQGAALASMTSRAVGAAVMFALMHRRSEECTLYGITRGPVSADMIRRITRIGVPSALDGSLFILGKLLVQSFIASISTSALAINAVVANFNAYSNIPGNAVSLSVITLVGYSAGAKRLDEERFYTRLMIVVCMLLTFTVTLPMFIFTKEVVSIYSLSEANTLAAVPICRLCLLMCTTIWPFSFTLPNALRATGDVRYTMTVSIASMWIFRVLMCYILIFSFGLGVDGAWYAMYADWAFRGILFLIRYRGRTWQLRKVI